MHAVCKQLLVGAPDCCGINTVKLLALTAAVTRVFSAQPCLPSGHACAQIRSQLLECTVLGLAVGLAVKQSTRWHHTHLRHATQKGQGGKGVAAHTDDTGAAREGW